MDLDRSSAVVYASQLGISLVGFVATVYFIRTLGARIVGAFFLFEALTNVLGTFTRLGVDTAIEKRMSESGSTRRATYLSTGFLLVGAPLLAITSLLMLVRGPVARYIGAPVVSLLVIVLTLGTSRWLFSAALRAEERVGLSFVIQFVGELVRVGLSLALILAGFELIGLLYGVVGGILAKIAITWIALDTPFGRPSAEAARSLFEFSKYNVGTNVSDLAYNWLDTIVLGLFVSKELVAVYEAAWKVSVVASMGASALATTIFPRVSRWHSQARLDEIAELFTTATTYALILVVPSVVGAALLGGEFLRIVYLFETGGVVLALLVGEKLAQAVRMVTQRVLLGIDRPGTVFRVTTATLAANVVLNFALVPNFELFGAALATLSTVILGFALQLRVLRREIDVAFDWRALGWQVLSASVMGIVVLVGQRFQPPTTEIELATYVAAGAATYGAVVLIHSGMRHRVRSLVRRTLA